MGVLVAVFNIASGIGIVNVYSVLIFETILQMKGSGAKLTAKQDMYFIGLSNFIGAILSYYSVSIFSRRTVFVGGHFFMGVLLFLTGYYIHIKQAELVLLSLSSYCIVF